MEKEEKTPLEEHRIIPGRGSPPVLFMDWAHHLVYKYGDTFPPEEQLKIAKTIARMKDEPHRDDMLDLLDTSGRLQRMVDHAREDADILSKTLRAVNEATREKMDTMRSRIELLEQKLEETGSPCE